MLAKRLAMILMLERGYSFSIIQKILKVTPQTIVRLWKITKQSSHKHIISGFWQELEEIVFFGMPPRGRQRQFMRRIAAKHS